MPREALLLIVSVAGGELAKREIAAQVPLGYLRLGGRGVRRGCCATRVAALSCGRFACRADLDDKEFKCMSL